jgi:hypothetical protein
MKSTYHHVVDSDQGANRRADYFSYATALGWEFPAAILSIMFAAGLIGLVASAVTGGPWAFVLMFLCVVAYMGYGFLYRRAYVVRVTDGVLSWHGCRYHGSRLMNEVEAITLGNFAGLYTWMFRDGTRMTMLSVRSLYHGRSQTATFLDEVGREYPDISMPGYLGGR